MSSNNPMKYFVNEEKQTNNSLSSKKSGKRLKDIMADTNKQELLYRYVESIEGYDYLKKILQTWTEKDLIYRAKKRAGLYVENYLPQIVVITGAGPKYLLAKEIANYCRKAEFNNTNRINLLNVNNMIRYYVQDVQDNFEKEIDKYGSELFYITGLDTLLANPRPPISDMHNWDSIIINMISKRLTRSNFSSPVIMPMSNQSYKAICQRFSLFEKNHIVLKCRNPGRVEMKAYVAKNLKEDGYNLNRFVMEKLNHTISKVFDNQEHRNVDYVDICWSLIDKIIEKQTRRLMETDHENLTKSRLKNITLVDIPKYVSIAEGQAIFF